MLTLDKKARDYLIWMFGKIRGEQAIKDIELKANQLTGTEWKYFNIPVFGSNLSFVKRNFDGTEEELNYDPVNHPRHYIEQSATIEPIEVLRFAPFDLGNALKYMIRAGHKDNELQDLKKAEWYLECALETWEANSANYDSPYNIFFRNYGRILSHFNGVPENLFTFPFPLSVLLEEVRTRIKLIDNQVKGQK